jgi:hypothetical protein
MIVKGNKILKKEVIHLDPGNLIKNLIKGNI